MRTLLRVVAVTCLMSAALGAQAPVPATSPTDASSGFIAPRLARVDAMVNRLIAEQRIPGAVVLLVRDGTVEYHKAYGYRDLGTKSPMRTDDIFRIASQTKAVTSLAAMMLWEEGKFSLDDPVSKYLPEFEKQVVLVKFNPADSTYTTKPAKRASTIRQLFTHTSGLDYADIGSDEFKAIYAKAGLSALGRDGELLADKVKVLGHLPLAFEPGERFNYGLSVDVLGRLVEVWSGMPLDRFLRTRIFEPLRMSDTWFELPADKRTRLVSLHSETDGKLDVMKDSQSGMHPDFPARRVTYFAGGAGLSGTTADYARFLQLFLNGGELDGVRLLGRKTVEMMLTNQIPRLQPAFGLGFALETPENDFRQVLSAGSFEWGGAFATTYWADPKEHLVALIYTNVLGLTVNLGDQFKVLVYSALR
ncbi:MAG: beta-lactamase family protein [Gemmatimonadaceae bacterium]|nr:beta-lactamase family protein [Gemmatimonadaceae bacterium]